MKQVKVNLLAQKASNDLQHATLENLELQVVQAKSDLQALQEEKKELEYMRTAAEVKKKNESLAVMA